VLPNNQWSGYIMSDNRTPKPKNVDYFQMPRALWRCVRRLLPTAKPHPKGGRPAADHRAVVNGIWYVLWTGCQWKAVRKEWFGVCNSTLHERFQEWQQAGIFQKVWILMLRFYARRHGIQWLFQAIDSKACPAPLGGEKQVKARWIGANEAAKSICWWISVAHPWHSISPARTFMISGWPTI
jgi:transposase